MYACGICNLLFLQENSDFFLHILKRASVRTDCAQRLICTRNSEREIFLLVVAAGRILVLGLEHYVMRVGTWC